MAYLDLHGLQFVQNSIPSYGMIPKTCDFLFCRCISEGNCSQAECAELWERQQEFDEIAVIPKCDICDFQREDLVEP